MNGEFKRYIYIIGTICAIFLVGSIILHILPWLLLAGVIVYIVMKVVKFIKTKIHKKNLDNFNNDNKDKEYFYNDASDDYTNGEIIDVEYEEIDNRKK